MRGTITADWGSKVQRNRWVIGVVGVWLLLVSCSSGDEGASPRDEDVPSTAEASADEFDPTDEGLRLVDDAEALQIDLEGNVESSEIAAVLDFRSGAGGIGACDNYFSGFAEDVVELAPDVGLATQDHLEPAVGERLSLCLLNWSDETEGVLSLPDGSSVPVPGPGPDSTYGPGVEIFRGEVFTEGELELQLATYPGAPTGDYEFELSDGSRSEVVSFEVETALDRGSAPRHFFFDTYAELFGTNINQATDDEVLFGFTGFNPSEPVDLFLYRSASTDYAESVSFGEYELTGDVAVTPNERGEAVVSIALDDSASGRCFRFDTHEVLIDEATSGNAFAVGFDPTVFCVPQGADQVEAEPDPATVECGSDCRITGEIEFDHPTWGASTLVTTEPSAGGSGTATITALDPEGEVQWSYEYTSLPALSPVDVADSYSNTEPQVDRAVDSNGHIFLNYNPGRYNGVIVLEPTSDGFEDFGSLEAAEELLSPFYSADVVGETTDGAFIIQSSTNDCIPSCAAGSTVAVQYEFNGEDYVPT